jgi:hypothetical protein
VIAISRSPCGRAYQTTEMASATLTGSRLDHLRDIKLLHDCNHVCNRDGEKYCRTASRAT